jgi:O-acetyl-ADP-ribose deacetylase (regulator of RNase III)/transcriptional regulator with XRE-family HTH domain
MSFSSIREDITKLKVDAIVNAANTDLKWGGGVCGAIFAAAGGEKLQAACDKLAPIKTGEAVITPGFNLPAKYVIHAAGPVYRDGKHGEEKLLRDTYTNALKRAVENGCESVAFPLISSGIYGYPKAEALAVATSAIRDFIADHDINVTLAVFDKSTFEVSRELLGDVESYIDEHYVKRHTQKRRDLLDIEDLSLNEEAIVLSQKCLIGNLPPQAPKPIEDIIEDLDEPFSETLLRLIDAKGKTDVEVYKRANLDRKLFSKIRTGKGYTPSKKTALALAIALELTLDETDDLLERAGYALSHAVKFDVILEYFIVSGKYDIFEINEVLFEYDQPILGG